MNRKRIALIAACLIAGAFGPVARSLRPVTGVNGTAHSNFG